MPRPLQILIAEDNPADAELVLRALRQSGFAPTWKRVENEADYLAHLHPGLDLILSDFEMPAFCGLRALELLHASALDVPFIIVSGTIGEETAVEAMRLGASDYLIKDRLGRLGPAVERALEQGRLRQEQSRIAAALQASEERFRQVVENIHEVFCLTELESKRVLYVSRGFEVIWGRTCASLYANPRVWMESIDALDRERVAQAAATQQAAGTYDETYRIVRPDGSLRWIRDRAFPIRDTGGVVRRIVSTAEDITEQHRLEEQFRQAQKMEAIGTLAGGIAHDFNNILTGIGGYTALAQMDLHDSALVREHLAAITQGVKRAADLVRQILTFGRQQNPERKPIPLRPVVVESLKLLRATLPTTIEFKVALGDEVPTVLADATAVHQAVMNLGTNAWYAMKDRIGCLTVTLRSHEIVGGADEDQARLRPGRYAVLTVGDTGCGMEPLTLRRMFEPFFTTKPPGEGTGLGLAVLHGIMQNHDGVVTATSQLGVGTEFQLYFPAHAGEVAEAAADEGPVPRGHGEHILVIDDEEILVRLGQKVLAALGYEVVGTSQPGEALALVRADPDRFALVLTDQTMPGMTGLQLTAQLRAIRPDLPIVLMTGQSQMLTRERLAMAGITQFLSKPMTFHALGTAVHAALAQSKTA